LFLAGEAYCNFVLDQVKLHDWNSISFDDPRRLFPLAPTAAPKEFSELPSRFFLRSCYVTMLKNIQDDREVYLGLKAPVHRRTDAHRGMRVLGTPGIGNTTGTIYWIVQLLRVITPSLPTFRIVWTLDLSFTTYCFQLANDRIHVHVARTPDHNKFFRRELDEPSNVHFHDTYVRSDACSILAMF